MQMDVRRLGYFVAVADHGGFTAAARAVHVSQPALSLAVKDLENEPGTRLFTRAGRKAQLTAAGQALLGPARQVLRDLQTGRAAVAAVTGLESGNLTLASLPTLAADPVAGLVGEFRRQYPGIRIDLAAPDDSTDLLDLVITGACELGVTEARDVPGTLDALSLGAQELALILPPGTATADWESGQLAATPFIAAPPGTSTRRLLDETLAAAGHRPRLAVVTAQRDAILPLVLAGAGAALVPESLATVAAQLGAVVTWPVPAAVRQLALVHRPGSLSPAAARFCEMARPG
jgi:LysR family carnitine catabolism transcriptional activator